MNAESKRILRALSKIMKDFDEEASQVIKKTETEAAVASAVAALSTLERKPGLNTKMWVLVVRAKAVVSGKRKPRVFWSAFLKNEGLV